MPEFLPVDLEEPSQSSLGQSTPEDVDFILNLKSRVSEELKNSEFPDLQFLFSPEALAVANDILNDLLVKEKAAFEDVLKTSDEDISFEMIENTSYLTYYFWLLKYYSWVQDSSAIRKIIDDFNGLYLGFQNEKDYSFRYYEIHRYYLENWNINEEQRKLIQKRLQEYRIRWIHLSETDQEDLQNINVRLSQLGEIFSRNVHDSRNEFSYTINDIHLLWDMPESDKIEAKNKAEAKSQEGFCFDLSHSSYASILRYCPDSSIRKEFYVAVNSIAKDKNNPIILEILQLRNRKARILWYKSYVELSLEFKMANSREEIESLFSSIAERVKQKAKNEIEVLKQYFSLAEWEEWDIAYYSNIFRREKLNFNVKEFQEYFEFENVLQGMFDISEKIFNIQLEEIDMKMYDDEVRVYKISRNGIFCCYFLWDYFSRWKKQQGAEALVLRFPSLWRKIISNTTNFQKSSSSKTLLSLDNVQTLFHEFGHALHEILSQSSYEGLTGFAVEWDFIELPSQLFENWALNPQGMEFIWKHRITGQRIPQSMLDLFKQQDLFWEARIILLQIIFALTDLRLHSENVPESEIDLEKMVQDIYNQYFISMCVPEYSKHTSFTHFFDGDEYAVGYFSYIWSEILQQDIWKMFENSWDIFHRELAEKLINLFSAWSLKSGWELFQDCMGRKPSIDAFLKSKEI